VRREWPLWNHAASSGGFATSSRGTPRAAACSETLFAQAACAPSLSTLAIAAAQKREACCERQRERSERV
jgi:hypothetical protein